MRTRKLLALPAALCLATTTLQSLEAEAKPYKGAEVSTIEAYQYGRFSMRMRMARGSGMLSTFFTYKEGSQIPGTFWEEIDIEVLGKNRANDLQTNVIIGDPRETTEHHYLHPTSLADNYHTYTLEWTDTYVAWFLDGKEVRRINGGKFVDGLQGEQNLRFNLWAASIPEWVGQFDTSILPQQQYINWFEYHSYNPASGKFQKEWRDDFNNFDTSRWSKANHSFDVNLVDFIPENAVVKDGTLVLTLTDQYSTGFSGVVPSDGGSTNPPDDDDDKTCSSTTTIPAKLQAEDFCEMSGIKTETTTDTNGGLNVGWIDQGDWLTYSIKVPSAGKYEVSYRVASLNGGGVLRLEEGGGNSSYGTLNVPQTGAWQEWYTISHTVNLAAGEQKIGLVALEGGWNINWLNIKPATGTPVTPTPTATPTPTPTPTVTPTNPGSGSCADIATYPNWVRKDWSGGPYTHNNAGDKMQYAGKVYAANWYTNSKPGSDGSWRFVKSCK